MALTINHTKKLQNAETLTSDRIFHSKFWFGIVFWLDIQILHQSQ